MKEVASSSLTKLTQAFECLLCRYKAASYKELEQRMDRQEKLRSIASEMSHKKALMVSQTLLVPSAAQCRHGPQVVDIYPSRRIISRSAFQRVKLKYFDEYAFLNDVFVVKMVLIRVTHLQGKGSVRKFKASEPGGKPIYKWRLFRQK